MSCAFKNLRINKDLVKNLLHEHNIDILCMQEIYLDGSVNVKEIETSNFSLEIETNGLKSRVGIYISKNVIYNRRCDLEGVNSNLLIVDIESKSKIHLINVYRSFNPQENLTQLEKFASLIKKATEGRTILVGDFNLDYPQKDNIDYPYANMFSDFEEKFLDTNLVQIIEFPTWSRIVIKWIFGFIQSKSQKATNVK